MNTLLVDTVQWDLIVDGTGNIAMATVPYALAQDVASAIKTFAGEVYYDITLGVPYFGKILGQTPSVAYFQQQMISAALTVPGVVSATCVITGFAGRQITGQVNFTDSSGTTGTVSL